MPPAGSFAVPRASVIVPVRNGAPTLARCLTAIRQTPADLFELIVVDDRSTDDSAAIARLAGARVVPNDTGAGPAAARNAGAEVARGDVLVFIDADIEVQPTTIAELVARFDADPSLAATFGSYDDEPHAENFISQYRNLLHHFVHQTSHRQSASFWAGCGAIRRRVFADLGGFDHDRYRRPAIEDIELGVRLRQAGCAVQLAPEIQVKHLKSWTPYSMVKTDVFDRAYPWSQLLLKQGGVPDDLNLRWQHRLSAVLVGVLAAALTFLALGHHRFYGVPVQSASLILVFLLIAQLLPLNRGFYGFLLRRRGWVFTARAVPVHFFYYFYSGVTFVVCWVAHHVARVVRVPSSVATPDQ